MSDRPSLSGAVDAPIMLDYSRKAVVQHTARLGHGPLGSLGVGYGYGGLVRAPFNVHVSYTHATSLSHGRAGAKELRRKREMADFNGCAVHSRQCRECTALSFAL